MLAVVFKPSRHTILTGLTQLRFFAVCSNNRAFGVMAVSICLKTRLHVQWFLDYQGESIFHSIWPKDVEQAGARVCHLRPRRMHMSENVPEASEGGVAGICVYQAPSCVII